MHSGFLTRAFTLQILLKSIYAITLCHALLSDIRHLKIPNHVSLIIIIVFVAHNYLLDDQAKLTRNLGVALFGLLLMLGFYAAKVMGAGDVKLISALLLWAGVRDAPAFLTIMALIGGISAALLLALRKTLIIWPPVSAYVPSRRLKAWASRGIFPYGIAICLAGLAMMPAFFSIRR
jgi:prepilin peptidase CpaA